MRRTDPDMVIQEMQAHTILQQTVISRRREICEPRRAENRGAEGRAPSARTDLSLSLIVAIVIGLFGKSIASFLDH